MQIVNLAQGSPEWHKHRRNHWNASDAAAMLGISPYKTRQQLVREYATGITEDVDEATQRRFDAGHEAEEKARPLAEKILGKELYPVVGVEGKLSASFDGIPEDETVCWEHKLLSNGLLEALSKGEIPTYHHPQLEQQLMVSGAERILFMGTSWDEEVLVEQVWCWYTSNKTLRAEIIAGWNQFEKDVADYEHVEHIPAAVAAPTRDLPVLSIQVQGSISLIDNLSVFGERLKTFVAEIDMNPSDDQGFADAEAAVKTLQAAQDALEQAEASALAQTSSIDEMRKTVKFYTDTARTTRLMLEKMVKARKESIRIEIVQGGKNALAEHIEALNTRLGKPYMPPISTDFAGAIKGKKNIASLHDAVATELARCKIEANSIADRIQINLNTLREHAKDYPFLFADAGQLVLKLNDHCMDTIRLRIIEHKQAEARKEVEIRAKAEANAVAKLEAERARIRAEEETKAKAAQDTLLAAERAKMEAETKAKAESDQRAEQPVSKSEQAAVLQDQVADRQSSPPNIQCPSRKEFLQVVAQAFKSTTEQAEKWLVEEFAVKR